MARIKSVIENKVMLNIFKLKKKNRDMIEIKRYLFAVG